MVTRCSSVPSVGDPARPLATARRTARPGRAGLFLYIEEPPVGKAMLHLDLESGNDARPKAVTSGLAAVTSSPMTWFVAVATRPGSLLPWPICAGESDG